MKWISKIKQQLSGPAPSQDPAPIELLPHKYFYGYYIDLHEKEVYSIKSGKLKKLQKKTWKGVTSVTLSHQGKSKTQVIDKLGKFVDRKPTNTILLHVSM
jgi:hypothetical protein